MEKIDFFGDRIFYEVTDLKNDSSLLRAAQACIDLHRAEEKEALNHYQADPSALEKVSEGALTQILSTEDIVNGIVTSPEISNCLTFNIDNVKDSLARESIHLIRTELDKVVRIKVRKLFRLSHELSVTKSGHFMYPPGGFMSWHTNYKSPGWRLYINYVEEPGKSFFRYRDPETGKVITSIDQQWNFRLFKIDAQKPFWHAVYSNTNRYSFGFRIAIDWDAPLYKRAWFRGRRLLNSVLTGNG